MSSQLPKEQPYPTDDATASSDIQLLSDSVGGSTSPGTDPGTADLNEAHDRDLLCRRLAEAHAEIAQLKEEAEQLRQSMQVVEGQLLAARAAAEPLASGEELRSRPLGRMLRRGENEKAGETSLPDAPVSKRSKVVTTGLAPIRGSVLGNFVLVAADLPPTADRSSGGLRLATVIELFAKLGRRVLFAAIRDRATFEAVVGSQRGREHYEDRMTRLGVERFTYGPKGTERMLKAYGGKIGLAFVSFPHVAQQLIPAVRARSPWATIAYDMVDLHSVRMARQAELASDAQAHAAAEEMARLERTCARLADVTIAISHEERRHLLSLEPDVTVSVIGNAFALPELAPPSTSTRRDILFVGGFHHRPNGDAVRWFVRHIWPSVHKKYPDARFKVVGADANTKVRALAETPGVEILGHVPDLGPLYQSCRMSVAPLRFGAGVKGKIGHSLAHGLPVVTTSIGAEGFGAQPGMHFLVADETKDFASHVLRLMRDDELWLRLRDAGRDLIERTQSLAAMQRELEVLLDV